MSSKQTLAGTLAKPRVSFNAFKNTNSVVFQFLWKTTTHYTKRSQLVKEYDMGGMRALDFESMVVSFKIRVKSTCHSQIRCADVPIYKSRRTS